MSLSRVFLLGTLLLAACQATPTTQAQSSLPAEISPALSAADLRAVTANKSYDVKPVRGETSVIAYADSGTVTLSGALNDTGKYRIAEGSLCTTWTKIRDGKEACQTFHRLPNGQLKILNLDKSDNSLLTLRP